MFCEECRKNLSTVYVIKVEDSEITKIHLCEKCAPRISEEFPFPFPALLFNFLPMTPSIFGSIFEAEDETEDEAEDEAEDFELDLTCHCCGFSFSDFREKGQLGCGECYEVFSEKLKPLLQSIHDSLEYRGRIPRKLPRDIKIKLDLRNLERQLKECVVWEEFEKAAQLRDEIKKLEKKLERERA